MSKPAILVVDDEAEIREGLDLLLSGEGYEVGLADSAEAALARLEERPYDLLLLDVSLPDRSGLDLLKEIRARDSSLAVILITAYGSIDMAREAFKNGARDYITKPWSADELLAQIAQALESRRLREENVQLKRAFKQRFNFPNIVGKSEKMLAVLELVQQVAPSRANVLIYGESGTGKELIAKAIHAASPRADKPFVPINTGSMPVDLLESLLFGHVRGAFTGAVTSKKGLFEVADQGTLFLDEISTIGPETQAKLLRVIQERAFMRLGGTETIRTDVRILAASNADLAAMVRQGRFREDLYHRLNVITIQLPPLRERREDIPLLASRFISIASERHHKRVSGIDQSALDLLVSFDWPGNIRQLRNEIERAVALTRDGEAIAADYFSPVVRGAPDHLPGPNGQKSAPRTVGRAGSERASTTEAGKPLREARAAFEAEYISEVLARNQGNVSKAARALGISRPALQEKMKQYALR